MKDSILKALKTKYANLGLNAETLDQMANFLATTVKEEKDIETSIGGVEPILKAFQADADKLRTEKAKADKELAETLARVKGGADNKPLEQPKPIETPPDAPEWAKSMLGTIDSLTKEIANIKTSKVISTRKDQLNGIISKLPEGMKRAYSRLSVDNLTDEQFAQTLSEITDETKDIIVAEETKGSVFHGAGTGNRPVNAKEASKDEVDALAEKMNI